MRKILLAVVFAILVGGAAGASQSKVMLVRFDGFAAYTLSDAEKLVQYHFVDKDRDAVIKMYFDGKLVNLNEDEECFVYEEAGDFVRIRRRGEDQEFWTWIVFLYEPGTDKNEI